MKGINDYLVTLHDRSKHSKQLKVRHCVSPSSACRVADILERMNSYSSSYRATMAYVLDDKGRPIYS